MSTAQRPTPVASPPLPLAAPAEVLSFPPPPVADDRAHDERVIRADRILPIALAAIALLVGVWTIGPWPVGAFQDDAIYVILAKALASGEGYRFINLPGEPLATHYPPGYPAVLALLWKAWPSFPDNIVLFKFTNTVFLGAAAYGAYLFARRRLDLAPLAASAAALVGTISVQLLLITGVVLSEPLFIALLFPVLFSLERAARSGRPRDAVLAGALAGALTLIRTLGFVAIPAGTIVLALRRRFKAAAFLALSGAAVITPWQIWAKAHERDVPAVFAGKYGSYTGWLVDGYREGGLQFAIDVIGRNLTDVRGLISYMFMPMQLAWPRLLALMVLLAVLLLGARRLVRRAPVTLVFLVFYVTIVLVWPFEPARFFLALWPLGALAFALGVTSVMSWRGSRAVTVSRALALAAVCAIAIGYATYNARGYRAEWWDNIQRTAAVRAKPVAEWVASHTAMTDELAIEDDLLVYLYTGRRSVPTGTFLPRERLTPLTPEENLRAVNDILTAYDVDYFITNSKPAIEAATRLSRADPPRLRQVGSMRHALIFAPVSTRTAP